MTEDKNLLTCTLKKSASVIKKLGFYAVCAITAVGASVLAIYGAAGIWSVCAESISKVIAAIISGIWSIPQYVIEAPLLVKIGLAGIGVLAAIGIYSFLWCIARDLTKEDWRSEEANALVFVFALALALALVFVFALVLTLVFALALVLTLALALALAVDPVSRITVWYYVFRFFGAYIHYRRRIKQ
jgi:hypothetical protein